MKILLSIVSILALALLPAKANLLNNGDFNTGTTSGWWTYMPDPTNQSITIETDAGFSYDNTPYAHQLTRNASDNLALGQEVSAAGGSQYSVSLMYRANNWGGAGIRIWYYDSAWARVFPDEWATIYSGNGTDTGWLPFSTPTWTAPAGTAYVSVSLLEWGWADTFYDNVNLSIIPEPASVVLLAAGSLALLIFRRRS